MSKQPLKYHKIFYEEMMKNILKNNPQFNKTIYHRFDWYTKACVLELPSSNTYEGAINGCRDKCNIPLYNLAPILYKNGYTNIKLMATKTFDTDVYMYILVDDKYVVDTSYRRLFRKRTRYNPHLVKHLYDDTPPIFIGTYDELYKMIDLAMLTHSNTHHGFLDKVLCNNLKELWSSVEDKTELLELNKLD